MKLQENTKRARYGALLALLALSAGCRLMLLTGVVAVGAVGLVGYSVYEGGEYAVTGVGSAAKAGAGAVSKGVGTVFFSGSELRTECPGSVEAVWRAANAAFRRGNLKEVTGNFDLLSGGLTAQTWERAPVTLKLKNTGPALTELRLQVGSKGDLKAAESIYRLIQAELQKPAAAAKTAAP